MLSRIDEFIESAYGTSCRHGFHDEDLSFAHQMMLAIGEVGEMVEADRKSRRSSLGLFDDAMRSKDFKYCFETYVKDTLEDELADVCIRLFDICGCFDIRPVVSLDDDLTNCWDLCYGKKNLCELSYALVGLLMDVDEELVDGRFADAGNVDVRVSLGCVLVFIQCLADNMGIDLDKHIELKMRYNESRGYKHGKKY